MRTSSIWPLNANVPSPNDPIFNDVVCCPAVNVRVSVSSRLPFRNNFTVVPSLVTAAWYQVLVEIVVVPADKLLPPCDAALR